MVLNIVFINASRGGGQNIKVAVLVTVGTVLQEFRTDNLASVAVDKGAQAVGLATDQADGVRSTTDTTVFDELPRGASELERVGAAVGNFRGDEASGAVRAVARPASSIGSVGSIFNATVFDHGIGGDTGAEGSDNLNTEVAKVQSTVDRIRAKIHTARGTGIGTDCVRELFPRVSGGSVVSYDVGIRGIGGMAGPGKKPV